MNLSERANKEQPNKAYAPLEIHLRDIILFFKRNYLTFLISAAIMGMLGILYSFTLTKTYTARIILMPEYSVGKSSFFSLAMGSNSENLGNLTPELYPSILESTSFGDYLLKKEVISQDNIKYKDLSSYMSKDSTQSIISKILGSFRSKEIKATNNKIVLPTTEIINYDRSQEQLVTAAKSLVKASIEQKNGLISIESEMPDPVVAAMLVEYSKNYLIDYVEDYRTIKLTQQLQFLTTNLSDAKKRVQNAEYSLQNYRDHNRNAFLNVARIEEQRLQSDFTIAQSLYNDIVQRQEQLKIKVKEEKPVFKVLEPVRIPLDKTSPRRFVIAAVFACLGFLSSFIYVIFFKEKLHANIFFPDNNQA